MNLKDEYKSIIDKGKSRFNANKTFLNIVKKRKIKAFDSIVHSIHATIFEQIDCIACANCCRTLGPRLSSDDISRLAKGERITSAQFILLYLKIDEDKDTVFNKMPCRFNTCDGLCVHYEIRPKACRTYPHTDQRNIQHNLDQLLQNTLYCPAAVLIVEELKLRI